MKYLLLLTLFVLTLFVNAQDKMGFGNDTEGADSAGIGSVTTWVKPEENYDYISMYNPQTGQYWVNGESYQVDWDTSLPDDSIIIDFYRSNSLIHSYKALNSGFYNIIPNETQDNTYSIVVRSIDSTVTSQTENVYFNVIEWTLELTLTTGHYYDSFIGNLWGFDNYSGISYGSISPENTGIQFLEWYDIPGRESRMQLNSTNWSYDNRLIYFKLDNNYYTPLLDTGVITWEFSVSSNPFGLVGSTHYVKILMI